MLEPQYSGWSIETNASQAVIYKPREFTPRTSSARSSCSMHARSNQIYTLFQLDARLLCVSLRGGNDGSPLCALVVIWM